MKTAEEWMEEIPVDKLVNSLTTREEFWWSACGEIELWELRLKATRLRLENLVNQIQLDAFKAGMTEAAGIIGNKMSRAGQGNYMKPTVSGCYRVIIAARDNKKEI